MNAKEENFANIQLYTDATLLSDEVTDDLMGLTPFEMYILMMMDDLATTFAADRLQISIHADERSQEPFKTIHDRLSEMESSYKQFLLNFYHFFLAPENIRKIRLRIDDDFQRIVDPDIRRAHNISWSWISNRLQLILMEDMETLKTDVLDGDFLLYYVSGLKLMSDRLKIMDNMDKLKSDFMTAKLSEAYYGLCLDLRLDISRFLSPGYHNGASFLNDKEAMEYLLQYPERCSDVEYLEMVTQFGPYPEDCSHRGMLTEIAATGNLKALEWALKKGLPWEESIGWNAARYGHIHILEYIQSIGHVLDEQCCHMAARYGHLETLKLLHEHGCPWNENTCISAVRGDQFEILQWLRDQGCPWDGETTIWAAGRGHLDILEWAWSHGCPTNATDIITNALDYRQLSVLRWGMEKGHWTLDDLVIFVIEREYYLNALRALKEVDILLDATSCALAARHDSLAVLQCLHEEAIPWDETTCEEAARAGAFDLLVWAREQGCPWDRRTCIAAAENQHWLILSWARENGCPHSQEDILSYLPE
jgi:hypothetical protein